ncbi:Gfo/Idh/MocA family protein [Candidatus Pantoea multigeneris]|uniref:Gfo/Idh/MocA family oxidoreductase n=1 Tax=Candidatus Pantoea multigeneris TaxID=2608357 RepID=A0ABX0RC94_9GAMM|nr:Gfo/Idh/MocA family oxidoreductase [Pantoea multigeneris]NIF22183.1 Gfo/Idh/MocA family oxidoreductase [Pantoea multigeneris]
MSTQAVTKTANPVRWGIVSTANIACARIIPALLASSNSVIHAIASRSQAKAAEKAAAFGIPVAYGSYEALLNDPQIEAIYVPLPNDQHVDMVLAATARGKHVLCEKPVALNAEQARRLLDVPQNLVVAEAFMVRHHPQFARLRAELRSGRHGKLQTAQILLSFLLDNPGDFRFDVTKGGGALFDLGCYTVMTARYLLERQPERVFCSMVRSPVNGTDEQTHAILDFGHGQQVTLSVGLKQAAAQRVQVVCEKSLLDLNAPYVPSLGSPATLSISSHAGLDDAALQPEALPVVEQYQCEVEHFSRAVRGEVQPEFGINDAIEQMQVMDALFASAASGQWVKV